MILAVDWLVRPDAKGGAAECRHRSCICEGWTEYSIGEQRQLRKHAMKTEGRKNRRKERRKDGRKEGEKDGR